MTGTAQRTGGGGDRAGGGLLVWILGAVPEARMGSGEIRPDYLIHALKWQEVATRISWNSERRRDGGVWGVSPGLGREDGTMECGVPEAMRRAASALKLTALEVERGRLPFPRARPRKLAGLLDGVSRVIAH